MSFSDWFKFTKREEVLNELQFKTFEQAFEEQGLNEFIESEDE